MASSRFVPIKPLLATLIRERYPELLVENGSALHDIVIEPMAVIAQLQQERIRLIERNQTLANYNLMLPEELDKLAANFLVTRKTASGSAGTQRVFFSSLQEVRIDASSEFRDTRGAVYRPIAPVSLSRAQLALNYSTEHKLFYVDVPIKSVDTGPQTAAAANTITTVRGVTGAVLTTNLTPLTGGLEAESNSELFARIKVSQTNRELVKRNSIAAYLQEQFPSITNVSVQGFGDAGMTRDIVYVGADIEELFPVAFCRKYNLPLDASGLPATDGVAAGGTAGFIVDNSGLDFSNVLIPNGSGVRGVAITPGAQIRFLDPDDADKDASVYTVTAIRDVTLPVSGEEVKALQLDNLLIEAGLNQDRPYTLGGILCNVPVHVGGKVDVYIDSAELESRTVTISAVPAAVSGVAEIPMFNATGSSIFENGATVADPLIAITAVEQLDAISGEVIQVLEPGTHYALVRADDRGRFAATTGDTLILKGTQTVSDVAVPLWTGTRIRITYLTDPVIPAAQQLLTQTDVRNLATDIQVKYADRIVVDTIFSYKGGVALEDVQEQVSNWINRSGFDDELSVSGLISELAKINVTDVYLPVKLVARSMPGNGQVSVIESEDRLLTSSFELFTPSANLSITKL